jgi:hypothetical protein
MTPLALTKSKHLLPFASVLKEHGVGVKRLLKRANLPVTCLNVPNTLIPAICVGLFRELAARTINRPHISLDATQYIDFTAMGDFGHALMREPTLLATLEKFRQLVATETSNVIIDLHQQSNGDLWFGQRMQSEASPVVKGW